MTPDAMVHIYWILDLMQACAMHMIWYVLIISYVIVSVIYKWHNCLQLPSSCNPSCFNNITNILLSGNY